MIIANMGVSMPVFWLGLILAYIFALLLKGTPLYIPPSGRITAGISLVPLATVWNLHDMSGLSKFFLTFISNSTILNGLLTLNFKLLKDGLWHLILPSLAVGTIPLATTARMTRSSLLEVLGQDYIRAARAKGVKERVVISKHALRNAFIPIVTIIGLEISGLLTGAVLTETVFNLPGMGSSMVNAILARDYPIIQGFTILIALIFVISNLIVDVSYAYLDPRIRLD
jgi:ABC-type dipeptide/oligopeptide/nickel transport system permease component